MERHRNGESAVGGTGDRGDICPSTACGVGALSKGAVNGDRLMNSGGFAYCEG